MYVMKKLLLIFIVLFTLIGSIDSQEFLGKNKALVKKEMQKNKGNGKTNAFIIKHNIQNIRIVRI